MSLIFVLLSVAITASFYLGNGPGVASGGPVESSLAHPAAEIKQMFEMKDAKKPEALLSFGSWSTLTMRNLFRFRCESGHRVDVKGRCRPVFLYKAQHEKISEKDLHDTRKKDEAEGIRGKNRRGEIGMGGVESTEHKSNAVPEEANHNDVGRAKSRVDAQASSASITSNNLFTSTAPPTKMTTEVDAGSSGAVTNGGTTTTTTTTGNVSLATLLEEIEAAESGEGEAKSRVKRNIITAPLKESSSSEYRLDANGKLRPVL